ncbi:MAG TPA: restriction endonuclease [Burkholderiales bacterium]|nr:restriction endonuclease [Burkholderiales bacterium]
MKMHDNSLFAVLLRSPFWVSGLVAGGIFGATRTFVPTEYAVFAAMPFMVLTVYRAWKQFRAPSAGRIAKKLDRVRAMSWAEFSAAIEGAFRRDGYTVNRINGPQADFELVRGSRSTLVACKRWKAASTGAEPLRELHAAGRAREAHELIYVAAGEVTAQGRAYAQENRIRVLQGAELAALVEP